MTPLRKKPGSPVTIALLKGWTELNPETGCWGWLKARQRNGYAVMRTGGKSVRVHRLVYALSSGQMPSSKVDICHTCDNRACINPAHLFAGTRTDNMRDCADKGRIRVPSLAGGDCPASKLTPQQVIAIRKDARSHRATARAYGVTKGTISSIRRGLTWRSL